jgi:transcriptional regulator with XRE-family HTH domain
MQHTNNNIPATRTVLENIHYIRRLKEYSQDFMAYKLSISQNAYSKLESGKTPLTMDRFFKIAELLHVPPMQLLVKDGTAVSEPLTQFG